MQITNRGSHVRGELKTKLRPLVEVGYGFESGENKKIISRNRQLYEDLKEGNGFIYRVCNLDTLRSYLLTNWTPEDQRSRGGEPQGNI